MKRVKYILTALLALALVFAFVACGTGSAQDETTQAALAAAIAETLEAVPSGPSSDALDALDLLLAGTTHSQQTPAPVTLAVATAATTRSTVASNPVTFTTTRTTTTTTAKAAGNITTKYAYTAASSAAKTTTTKPSTTSQTTTATITLPRTAATPTQTRPSSVNVTIANLQAVGKPVTMSMTFTDSIGQTSTRSYTGVRMKDFLAARGVPLSSLRGVTIRTSDEKMPDTAIFSYMSDNTLLAWEENGSALAAPRLCPGDSSHAGDYIKYVVSLGLTY